MFSRKIALTGIERAEYRARIRQLQAEGIDVHIPDEWQEPSPLIIELGRQQGQVCDLGAGNTGYAIPLRIIGLGRVIVTDYVISSAWDISTVDLACLREKKGRYQLGPLDYGVTEVLNDKLEQGFRLTFRGDMVEGVVIAWGYAPVPNKYRRETLVPVHMVLVDSLHRETAGNLLLPGCAAEHNQEKVRSRGDAADIRQKPDAPGGTSDNAELTCGSGTTEAPLLVDRTGKGEQPAAPRRSTLFDGEKNPEPIMATIGKRPVPPRYKHETTKRR